MDPRWIDSVAGRQLRTHKWFDVPGEPLREGRALPVQWIYGASLQGMSGEDRSKVGHFGKRIIPGRGSKFPTNAERCVGPQAFNG
jgi:hypothetical protein